MGVMWTTEQQKVIDSRDCNILVSAAAGSGKTAVLVERIISMVTDPVHPVDIDRLLIVTFTRAAAGEMRERIRLAIEKKLAPREKKVLQMRYGLGDGEPVTQREIAKMLNISRSYVSRIETKALGKLKSEIGDKE